MEAAGVRPPGVGLPRGRGRLSLKLSPGLSKINVSKILDMKRQKKDLRCDDTTRCVLLLVRRRFSGPSAPL